MERVRRSRRADSTPYESGVWAEDFVVMDEMLVQAGFNVDIATPSGVAPTMAHRALNQMDPGAEVL